MSLDNNLIGIIDKKEHIRNERLKTENKLIYFSPFLENKNLCNIYYTEFVFYKTKNDNISLIVDANVPFELLCDDVIIEHYNQFHRVYIVKNINNELRLENTLNYYENTKEVDNYIKKIVNFRCL